VAVTLTHKTTGGTATDGTSATVTSASYDAGKVILAAVLVDKGSAAAADTPTLTGLSATWDEVDVEAFAASDRSILRLFRTVLGSPQTGTLTIGVATTHGYFGWSVSQCENAATGSNGADAVVQTVSADDGGVSAATLTVNLTGVVAGNVTFGCLGKISTATVTAGTNFTELGENVAEQTIQSQWSSTGEDACAWSWSGNQRHGGIAIELTEASSTPSVAELVASYTSTVPKVAGTAATATVTAAVGDVLVLHAVADCVGDSAGGTATMGKLDDGTGVTDDTVDRKAVSSFTAASSGTLQSATMRVWLSATGSCNLRAVVYADSAGSPGALLATSDEEVVNWTTEQAVTCDFSGGAQISIVSGTTYWIGFHHSDPGALNFKASRGATADLVASQQDTYSGGASDPFGTVFLQPGPNDLYVTYGESGGGDALPTGAVTDSAGNTWTRKAFKGTTAAAGTDVEIAIYTCTVATALTSGTVTLTPHTASAAKCFVVDRFTGVTETARGTVDTSFGTSTVPSVTTTDPVDDDIVFGLAGFEGPSGDTVTADTDTSNGSWSTGVKHGTTGDTDASNVTLARQWKQVTATASQTWNLSLGTSRDWQSLALVLQPDVDAPSSVYTRVMVLGHVPTADDYTIELDMVIVATTPAQEQRLVWRGQPGTEQGYLVEVHPDVDTIEVSRLDAAGVRDEKLSEALAVSAATVVHVKVEATGTAHKAKWWLDGASEPGTWDVEFTDATYTTGYVGPGFAAASEASMDVDNYELTL
jgi:hypothetical protein